MLDFLVTAHIYTSCPHTGPGTITDTRSAIVCNNMFARWVAGHVSCVVLCSAQSVPQPVVQKHGEGPY